MGEGGGASPPPRPHTMNPPKLEVFVGFMQLCDRGKGVHDFPRKAAGGWCERRGLQYLQMAAMIWTSCCTVTGRLSKAGPHPLTSNAAIIDRFTSIEAFVLLVDTHAPNIRRRQSIATALNSEAGGFTMAFNDVRSVLPESKEKPLLTGIRCMGIV